MFVIYKAQTAQTAAEKVISAIGKTGRHIVIAPDAFTVAIEKAISASLKRKGFFNVEVMSFARLASVFLGQNIEKCLSPSGSVMLMEKVIRKEKDQLLLYNKAAEQTGFASEIYAAITAIRNSGVTPDDLFAIEGKIGRDFIRKKTHDIAHLYAEYLKELEINHTDSTTRLEALAAWIRSCDAPSSPERERTQPTDDRDVYEPTPERRGGESLGDVTFYIVDHIDLNAKQLEVVAALLTKAKGVVVAVPDAAGALNERIYPHLIDKLRKIGKEEGVPLEEISVPAELSPDKRKLADELFSYSFSKGKSDSLSLYEAKDAEEEVTLLATEVVRLVRKEGRRYNDFAVITPSFGEYLPIVERIFKRYEIPFFADDRSPLSSSALFRHILLAMELRSRNYDKNALKKYVLHALFEGAMEEKAAFCDYIDKSGADHSIFKKPFSLFSDDPLYAPAEKVRGEVMKEVDLFDKCPPRAKVSKYAAVLLRYLSDNSYDEKVKIYYAGISEEGLPDKAEILRQVPQAMMGLLTELTLLRGEEEVAYDDFIKGLRAGAEQIKIASLPVSLDCVYFAPVEQAMYAPIHALWVLGAESGVFPREQMGEGILGSSEYREWQMNEVTIENVGVEELIASRFHALQLLLRGERLYLSYRESCGYSPCIRQMLAMFDITVQKCAEAMSELDIDDRVPTDQVAEIYLLECSRRYHEGILGEKDRRFAEVIAEAKGRAFPYEYEEETGEYLSAGCNPFFSKGTASVSALETYFKCPFMHFVRYGLDAVKKQAPSYNEADVGTFLHEFLKRYLLEVKKSLAPIDDAMVRSLTHDIVGDIYRDPDFATIAIALGGRHRARVEHRAEVVAFIVRDHLKVTDFRPAFVEIGFPKKNGGKGPSLVTVDLEGVPVKGRIDRVDLLQSGGEKCAVAYDYKSGSAGVEVSDLYFGKKIQLHVYLAILEASGYTPSAALYYKLATRSQPSDQLLHGPKSEKYIHSLEKTISEDKSIYTGVYLKDGALTEGEKQLLPDDVFRAQIEYAVLIAEQAIREIKAGYVRSTPLGGEDHLPCKYCDAVTICRHRGERARPTATVTAETIYDIVKATKEPKPEVPEVTNDGIETHD